jgi:hypothetical protein
VSGCLQGPSLRLTPETAKGVEMSNFMKALVVLMALGMVATWSVWASDQVKPGEAVEVTGTVLESGHLQDDQGQKHMLAKDDETMQLMSHVGAKVEIKGTLIEQPEGETVIKIESYQVVTP